MNELTPSEELDYLIWQKENLNKHIKILKKEIKRKCQTSKT